MDTVFLCEKQSQAKDIAKELGLVRSHKGYFETKGNVAVTYASGHLLELEAPHEYNPAWKTWTWEALPLVRSQWNYNLVDRTKGQFAVIKALLKSAKTVVIATDAGREGELIARLILRQCKYKGPIKRFWTGVLTAKGIQAALGSLLPGSAKEPLYEAAVARQHCDNIYGMSASRAATLAAKVPQVTFPMGRVQTPVLGLVAARDMAIKTFVSEGYYILEAQVQTASGSTLAMRYAPDVASRIKTKADADTLIAQAVQAQGPLRVAKTPGVTKAPLPYSLPVLQRDANKVFGLSAKATLAAAQALYEKKVTTYPRTDCRHLDPTQKGEIAATLSAVGASFSSAVEALQSMGVLMRDSTFDASQLSDHHGIVPTTVTAQEAGGLTGPELQVYTLVCQQFLRCLAPDARYTSTKVSMDANGVPFKATGRITESQGWQALKLI